MSSLVDEPAKPLVQGPRNRLNRNMNRGAGRAPLALGFRVGIPQNERLGLERAFNDAVDAKRAEPGCAEAAAAVEDALAAMKTLLGPDHPSVLSAMGGKADSNVELVTRATEFQVAFLAWRKAYDAANGQGSRTVVDTDSDTPEETGRDSAATDLAANLARNLSDVGDRLKERLLAVKGALIEEVATRLESMNASHEGFEHSAKDKTVALCRALADLETFFSADSGLTLSMQADAFTIAATLGLQAAMEFSVGNRTDATSTLQTALELPGVNLGGIDFTEAAKALQARLLESLVAEACVITNRYGDACTVLLPMLSTLAGVDDDVDELCNLRFIEARAHMGLGNLIEAEVSLQWVLDHLSPESPVATSPCLWAYTELLVKGDGLSSGAEAYYDHCFVEFQLKQLLLLLGKHRTTPLTWSAPAGTCAPLAAPGTQAGTPQRAPPSAAAADTPVTPEAASCAAAIEAAAAALPFGWVPGPDKLTGMVCASSPDAPYTDEQGPQRLLDVCRKRLGDYVLGLSKNGADLIRASPIYASNVLLPFALPKESTNFVSASALLKCAGSDSADLSPRVYSEVVSSCIAALAHSTVVSLGILVALLGGARDASFPAWRSAFGVLAVDIAQTMSRAAEMKGLFERAGYRHCSLTQ
jgi:hypothetical protein